MSKIVNLSGDAWRMCGGAPMKPGHVGSVQECRRLVESAIRRQAKELNVDDEFQPDDGPPEIDQQQAKQLSERVRAIIVAIKAGHPMTHTDAETLKEVQGFLELVGEDGAAMAEARNRRLAAYLQGQDRPGTVSRKAQQLHEARHARENGKPPSDPHALVAWLNGR